MKKHWYCTLLLLSCNALEDDKYRVDEAQRLKVIEIHKNTVRMDSALYEDSMRAGSTEAAGEIKRRMDSLKTVLQTYESPNE